MVKSAPQVSIAALEVRLSHPANMVVDDYDTEYTLQSAIEKAIKDYAEREIMISHTDGPAFRISTNCNVTSIKVAIMVSTDADTQEFMEKLKHFLNNELNGFEVIEISMS